MSESNKFKEQFEARPIREGGLMRSHERMIKALESLRDRVDNFNQFPRLISVPGDVTKELKPTDFRWIMWENTIKFGYRMEIISLASSDYMLRQVAALMKSPDTFNDMSKREFKQLMTSIVEVFFVQGAGEISNVFDEQDTILCLSQMVPIMWQTEKSPNIVTPTKELINKGFNKN